MRRQEARVDDKNRRKTISKARKLIYGKFGVKKNANYGVNSTAVEKLLKKQSLVPTEVCFSYAWKPCFFDHHCYAECILRPPCCLWI